MSNNFDIVELSEIENDLIRKSKNELGDVIMLCFDLLKIIQNPVSINKENEIFPLFQMQVVNGFFLSVMSCIRRHTVQCHLMLRHTLESLVFSCYSLYNFNIEFYGEKNDFEFIRFNVNKVIKKAYPFIAENYPEQSDYIKRYKNCINLVYSHSCVHGASLNIGCIDNKYNGLFFDSYFDSYIREVLMYINDLMIFSLKFFMKLSKDFKTFLFTSNIQCEVDEYEKRHNKIFNDYTQSEHGKKRIKEGDFNWLTEKKLNNNNE